MHVPDGFLDLPTSVTTGVVAAGAVGVALRRSKAELGDAGAVRAGLTACFVFAAQMVNFPVASGTSGHLLGAALAVALVGPWTACLVMTSVLMVQALFFADGGLTALGTNIVLMGVVGVLMAWLVQKAGTTLTRGRVAGPGGVALLAGISAFVSVPMAALTFALLFAAGGAVPVSFATLVTMMVGTHLVIGIGEAVITSAVVGAVAATRPDLVRLASAAGRRTKLRVTRPDGTTETVPAGTSAQPGASAGATAPTPRRMSGARLATAALATCAVVAGGLSLLASSSPDGLEWVAERLGFEHAAQDSAASVSVLADYGLAGMGPWGTGVAGLIGTAATLALAFALVWVARRGRHRPAATGPAADGTHAPTASSERR